MFHTNFDDLENSLTITIQAIKKKELLDQASLVKRSDRQQIELRKQLEEQSQILNRIKDHHREIRDDPSWPALEIQAKELLNIRSLFTEEQKNRFEIFRGHIVRLITAKRNELDENFNERIIENGQIKADRSKQVKIYKNWTSV